MKNMFRLYTFFILSLAGFLLSACSAKKTDAADQQGTAQAPSAIAVDGFVANHESLDQVVYATGSLLPNESVKIRPERAGKITSIHFKEGQFVKQGTLLFSLDTDELKAQAEKLKVQKQYFESELQRAEELIKIQAITGEEFDRMENQLQQVEADMALNQVYQDKSKIRAPFSGTIGLRMVSEGAYITPADVLVDLEQSHPIKLEFEVPERYLRDVKTGQELSFTVIGVDKEFKATVYALSNQISPETRSFTVRGKSDNPDGILKPGAFARIELVTRINEEAILIPTDAVIPVLEGQQVFIARSGRAIAQSVETGVRKKHLIEIVEGVQAGDTLLVSGLLSLSDGLPVQVRSIDSTSNSQQ